MSTKATLKYEYDVETRRSFHLYEDVLDQEHEHVYLELEGFQFEAASHAELLDDGVAKVVIRLPRSWAAKMGILTS